MPNVRTRRSEKFGVIEKARVAQLIIAIHLIELLCLEWSSYVLLSLEFYIQEIQRNIRLKIDNYVRDSYFPRMNSNYKKITVYFVYFVQHAIVFKKKTERKKSRM